MRSPYTITFLLAPLAFLLFTPTTQMVRAQAFGDDDSETVMVTLRPKAGSEEELLKVVATHWSTGRRLNLVQPEPHVTVRTKDEAGRPVFVDIFTWRDRETPDHAPAEILTIWNAMNRLVETRGGRPGIEIAEVTLVR